MQTSSFRQKIHKEHSIVIKELSRFTNTFQGKIIQPPKLQTYCNQINYLTQLHSSYVYNCMEYFTPIMKQQMIQVNKTIVQDLVKKIKYCAQYNLKSAKSYLAKDKKQICQLCSSKIRQVDVKIIKQHLSDDASLRRNLLRKIYADLENQNAQLFSKDQDQIFFKFLNRILIKKEELLTMQTKELSDFLFQVTKSLGDLNFLTQYTPGNFGVDAYKENYKDQLSKTITQSLKTGFGDKIHPWVEKVFQSVKKQILAQKKGITFQKYCQTQSDQLQLTKKRSQYKTVTQNKRQLQTLKQQIQQNTLTITELKSKLTVIQKQKQQLQQYYAQQLHSLQMQKRQVEIKLRKTQTDFYQLKQTNEQISDINKKLRLQKKKTQQSLTNKSNKSINIKDSNDLLQKQTKDEINQNKSEKSSRKKKKRSPINRLLSKNSQSSQRALFKDDEKEQSLLRRNNNNESLITIKKTASSSEIINNKQSQQPLISIKKPNSKKKSLKNLDRPLSRRMKSPQQQQQKVQFKLQHNQHQQSIHSNHNSSKHSNHNSNKHSTKSLPKSKKTITQIASGDDQIQSTMNNNSRVVLKKKSSFVTQKKKKTLPKRNLSIEMTIPFALNKSGNNREEQSIRLLNETIKENHQQGLILQTVRQQQGYVNNNKNDNKILTTNNNNSKSPTNNKKVFSFKPLQNKQQYEQLKQKITQLTSKIQLKTNQKLKSSIKHIMPQQQYPQYWQQYNNNNDLCGEMMGSVYGYSIFNNSKINNNGNNNSRNNNNSNTNRKHQRDNNSNSSSNNSSKHQLIKITDPINQQNTNDQYNNQNINNPSHIISPQLLLEKISQNEHQLMYKKLQQQSIISRQLTLEHYQLIVRKLFASLGNNQLFMPSSSSSKSQLQYHSRASSLNHHYFSINANSNTNNELLAKYNNSKHQQQQPATKYQQLATKINNIDSKLLQIHNNNNNKHNTNKIHQQQNINNQQSNNNNSSNSKVILNLPKLDKISINNINNNNINNNSKISSSHSNLTKINSRQHFNINTMRQRLNAINNKNNINDNSQSNIINNNDYSKLIIAPQKDNNNTPIQPQQSLNNNNRFKSAQLTPNHNTSINIINKHKQIFSINDLNIFFDSQLAAYQYQQSSKYRINTKIDKSNNNQNNYNNNQNNKSPQSKQKSKSKSKQRQHNTRMNKNNQHITQKQVNTIQSLYTLLQQIRIKNHQIYHKICSFLKYPYQTVKYGFQFINISKDISYEKWYNSLLKLYGMKCIKSQQLTFEQFIQPFQQKLVQLIVLVNNV